MISDEEQYAVCIQYSDEIVDGRRKWTNLQLKIENGQTFELPSFFQSGGGFEELPSESSAGQKDSQSFIDRNTSHCITQKTKSSTSLFHSYKQHNINQNGQSH